MTGLDAILIAIVIVLVWWYIGRMVERDRYLLTTRKCPDCDGRGRINVIETWAGDSAGDPCPTCHETGRIPL